MQILSKKCTLSQLPPLPSLLSSSCWLGGGNGDGKANLRTLPTLRPRGWGQGGSAKGPRRTVGPRGRAGLPE